jgi:hypothetical protein
MKKAFKVGDLRDLALGSGPASRSTLPLATDDEQMRTGVSRVSQNCFGRLSDQHCGFQLVRCLGELSGEPLLRRTDESCCSASTSR